jgi:hypothetical protein
MSRDDAYTVTERVSDLARALERLVATEGKL